MLKQHEKHKLQQQTISKWLEDYGFNSQDKIQITIDQGILIIKQVD